MTPKQIRLLQLLDQQILTCVECPLHKNGRAKPYWTPESKYVMVGEAPGKDEVLANEPFVGRAGGVLWGNMTVTKPHFLVINSVNCRPVDGKKNGKPTESQKLACRKWIRKYIMVLAPKTGILFGDHAIGTMCQVVGGVTAINATTLYSVEFDMDFVRSVHPAYSIYNAEEGSRMLRESIILFDKII